VARSWEHDHLIIGSKGSEDVATSMSDLRPLVQARVSRMTALSIRDEKRRVEWLRRKTPLAEGNG
jgi:hypothetical protein